MITVALYLLLVFLAIITWHRNKNCPSKFPPGPKGLPIIGNLHQIGNRPDIKFMEFGKKYGNIFALKYGCYRVLVLNNHKDIRDAFSNPVFCGRPKFVPGSSFQGIFFNAGQSWKEQRNVTLKILRDQGFGKATTEVLIQSEISNLIDELSSLVEKPIDTKRLFLVSVINTIWPLAVGSRLRPEDSLVEALANEFLPVFEKPRTQYLRYFPTLYVIWLRMSALICSAQKKKETVKKAQLYFTDIINQHRETIDWNGTYRDLVDEYLKHIKMTTDANSHFYQDKGLQNLVKALYDLLLAGADTSSRTLHWMFLLLAAHPQVQIKMHQEIYQLLGQHQLPTLKHKKFLPYTQSVVLEVLRFSSFVPLGIYHSTTEDTKFRGYHIPKNTIVISNLYAAMHDPQEWVEPERFWPERFLSEDEATVKMIDAFSAFSTGKRVCPGMSHGLDTLFLFATRILQKFEIQPAGKEIQVATEYFGSIFASPKPFQVKIVARNNVAQRINDS